MSSRDNFPEYLMTFKQFCNNSDRKLPKIILTDLRSTNILINHVVNNVKLNDITEKVFEDCFFSKDYLFIRRILFFTRIQSDVESVKDYKEILEEIGQSCSLNELCKDLVYSRFVTGIRDLELQERLLKYNNSVDLNQVLKDHESYTSDIRNTDDFDNISILSNNPLDLETEFNNDLCDICDSGTKTPRELQKHIHQHTTAYSCAKCNRKFKYLHNFQRHKHEQSHFCQLCKKHFETKKKLYDHKLVHSKDRPHQCLDCNKWFVSKSKLRAHELVHTGERPFKCEVCKKSFNRNSYLNVHLRTHSGDRPFVCESCGKSFSTTSQLNKHLRVHTGERPYSCSVCSKSFNQSSHLKTHVLMIHKIKFKN